ncbi:MAG TPA: transcription antitermination protein NusB [Crocinitomicaceae bacterium]|jgi:transcription antitermination protein NusB|nr:transcription antitermination protein NusB [Crocinitomicaceae bacterium]
MLNRRHLRIKILQALYAFFQSHNSDKLLAERELYKNIEQIHDLYLYFLLTFDNLVSLENNRLEDLKNKRFKSEDANTKFINNAVFKLLENNTSLNDYASHRKISWVGAEEQEMLRKVMAGIRETEVYTLYMANENQSFDEDMAFAVDIFKEAIANSPLIYGFFEEKSIHWLDDIDLACSMVIKTLKTFSEDGLNSVLSLYKDEEDERDFITRLFRRSIEGYEENRQLIDELISNWELDRLALMDILLMNLAITEVKEFSNIPVKVTLNEYIEISKFYSTPKSNGFINGVLDKAVVRLTKENKIVKAGRGLKD